MGNMTKNYTSPKQLLNRLKRYSNCILSIDVLSFNDKRIVFGMQSREKTFIIDIYFSCTVSDIDYPCFLTIGDLLNYDEKIFDAILIGRIIDCEPYINDDGIAIDFKVINKRIFTRNENINFNLN